MALPAGRYGVTKNQLLKIKKLPMNTIKLIEELTEKFNLLGAAAFKNSTSVVTESSDLVESGAVKDIVGWGNKNKLPYFTETKTGSGTLTVIPSNGRYSFTGTAGGASAILYPVTVPINSGVYRFVADGYEHVEGSNISLYYNDNGTTKALAPDETIDLSIYAITAIAFFAGANNSVNYLNIGLMLVKESESDKSFEPYHASVEETLRDAEVVEGKNLLPYPYYDKTKTISGITFTVNTDGSITVSGTATNNAYFDLSTNFDTTKFAGMLLNGLPIIGGLSYRICSQNDRAGIQDFYDNNTVISNNGSNLRLAIRINNGTTISNPATFYPMVSKDGGAYEPYYVPLKDVVPNKCDNSVIGTVEDGAKPTKSYAVGEHMVRGGKFCTVKVPVTTASTWSDSYYVEGDVAELFTKQKITSIAVDGTILKSIVSNDSYIIPAYKLAVLNLLVQVGTYAAWGVCLTGLPKPVNNVCAVIANRGKSTAMLLSILEQGNAQLTNITGADPVENNVIVIAITYNYDSL